MRVPIIGPAPPHAVACAAPRLNSHDIVIAGGGIAGLYCARRLADAGHQILILEASSDRWGGRIETEDLDGFIAEMGPMRFEPTLQPRFAQLCADLGVELVDFAGPSADPVVAIDTRELHADNVDVNVGGVGHVKVWAGTRLDASVGGVGSLTYYGEPKTVNTNGGGLGSISKGSH